MVDKDLKAQTQNPAKNVATWPLLIAAAATCTLHLVLPHIGEKGIPFPKPGHLIMHSILGLVFVNVFAFTASLLSGIKETAKITQDDSSSKQDKEERAERVLAPAIRGDRPPPLKAYCVARFCFWVLIGVIVGSLIAYVIQFNIDKFSS